MSLALKTRPEVSPEILQFPGAATDASRPGCPSADHLRRIESLQEACRFLADGYEDLDESIAQYLAESSRSPFETDADEIENFLHWLADDSRLTPQQRDEITRLQSHQAIERVVLRRRLAHLRFQEMLQAAASQPAGDQSGRRMVHLNPVHVWATFESHALIAEDADLPATVVVYQVGAAIRTLVIDGLVKDMIRRLEHYGPLPLPQVLRGASREHRDQLQAWVFRLSELGLLALS